MSEYACRYGGCRSARWHAPARVRAGRHVGSGGVDGGAGAGAGDDVLGALVCVECFRSRVPAHKVACFTPPVATPKIEALLKQLRKFHGREAHDWQWDMVLRDWTPVSNKKRGRDTSSSSDSGGGSDSGLDADWEAGNDPE